MAMGTALHSLTAIKKVQRHAMAAGAITVSLAACHADFAALFVNVMKDPTR
jgi:hypothetical protein